MRVICGLSLSVTLAVSCPACRTNTDEAVRSGIFNNDFGFNLLVTVLPFVFFYAIAALIYFGVPKVLTARREPGR